MTARTAPQRLGALAARAGERLESEPPHHQQQLVGALESLLSPWLDGSERIGTAIIAAAAAGMASSLMPIAEDRDRRRRAAFHEAGHTIACIEYGIGFVRVTVDPHPVFIGAVDGYVLMAPMIPEEARTDRERIRLERRVIMDLAGPIAEQVAGYPASQACIDQHREDADRLLLRLVPWHSLDELRALRHYLDLRAARCVREWWPRVERVADALLERGTLTRAEVVALLAPHTVQETAA